MFDVPSTHSLDAYEQMRDRYQAQEQRMIEFLDDPAVALTPAGSAQVHEVLELARRYQVLFSKLIVAWHRDTSERKEHRDRIERAVAERFRGKHCG